MKKIILVLIALVSLGGLLYSMKKATTDSNMITVQVSDGQKVEVPKSIADRIPVLEDIMGDLQIQPGATIPLPEYAKISADALQTIVSIVEKVKEKYFQETDLNIVDDNISDVLADKSIEEINAVIHAAYYFDLPYISNQAIRVSIMKWFEEKSDITRDEIIQAYRAHYVVPKEQQPSFEELHRLLTKNVHDYLIDHPNPYDPSSKSIDLRSVGLFSLDGLDAIPNHDQAKRLDLAHNWIKFIDQSMFEGYPHVELLDLRKNEIESLSANTFANMPNLKEIDLELNEITTIEPGAFARLNKLRKINLNFNKIRKTADQIRQENGLSDNVRIDLRRQY